MPADGRCRPERGGPVHRQGTPRSGARPAVCEPRQLLGVRPRRFGRRRRRVPSWLVIGAQVRGGGERKVVAADAGALPRLDRH